MNKQELLDGLNSLKFEMVHGFLPPDYLQSSNCIYKYSCGYNGTNGAFKNNICYMKLSLYGVFHIFDESTEAIVLWIKSENKETVEEAIESLAVAILNLNNTLNVDKMKIIFKYLSFRFNTNY